MESARNRCALRGRRNVHQTGNEQTRRGSPRCSDLHGLPGRTARVGKQRGRAATEVRDAGRYYRCGSCVPPRSQGQGYDSPTAPSRRRPCPQATGAATTLELGRPVLLGYPAPRLVPQDRCAVKSKINRSRWHVSGAARGHRVSMDLPAHRHPIWSWKKRAWEWRPGDGRECAAGGVDRVPRNVAVTGIRHIGKLTRGVHRDGVPS